MAEASDGDAWFHAAGGERHGPFDGTTLRRLVAEGAVDDATLVWREGWDQWRPLGEVRDAIDAPPGEPMVRCLHSGEWRPVREMLRYGEGFVAPEHKDAFVARLERGEDPTARLGPDSVARAGFGELMTASLRLVAARFGLLMAAYGIVAIPIAAVSNFIDYEVLAEDEIGRSVAWYSLIDLLFGPLGMAAAIAVLGAAVDGRRIGLGQALATGLRWWVPMMLTGLLVTILAGFGIVLLVVPGVLVLVRSVFFGYIVVEEGRWGGDGFSRSWRMSRGYGWLIFGSGLLFGLVIAVGSALVIAPTAWPPLDHWLVVTAGQVLLLPLEIAMTAFFFLLYRQVRAREASGSVEGLQPPDR